jgi:hypothetical protein
MLTFSSPTLQSDLNDVRLHECFESLLTGNSITFGDQPALVRMIRRIEEDIIARYEVELAVNGPDGWMPIRCDLVWGTLVPDANSSRRLFQGAA